MEEPASNFDEAVTTVRTLGEADSTVSPSERIGRHHSVGGARQTEQLEACMRSNRVRMEYQREKLPQVRFGL